MARASNPKIARAAALRIVRRLREQGHAALFAGGCVRDELLGLHPTDYDVATDATPGRVRELFPKSAAVGAAFGVVLVHERLGTGGEAERVSVEVATFRRDGPYSDARRPDAVSFSDPRSDAERRDFTINALFLDPLVEGERSDAGVIDFVGGRADLAGRVIRAVGDADRRLAEDHLRGLRAVRFAARLGFTIEAGTAAAVRRQATALRGVSRERIGEELRRMLASESRGVAVRLLTELGLDGPMLDEPCAGEGVIAACANGRLVEGLSGGVARVRPERLWFSTGLAAWAIERHGLDAADNVALKRGWRAALCLSNDESEEFSDVLAGVRRCLGGWLGAGVAEQKRAAAWGWFGQALVIVHAHEARVAERILMRCQELEGDGVGISPVPLVTGDLLVEAGMKPGPAFKVILDRVYDAQLEGRVRKVEEGLELAGRLNV